MRYKAAMKRVGMAVGLILLACTGCSGPPGVEIPQHDTRHGPAGGFRMGRCEVTVREFAAYLNAERVAGYPGGAQIERRGEGRYAVRRGSGRQAVAEVTPAEAEAYCRWLAEYIAGSRIGVEVCLTSNLQTTPTIRSVAEHPLARMMAYGLSVSLCTDNRLVSDTSVCKEMQLAADEIALQPRQLKNLVVAGFKGSFFPDSYSNKRAYVRKAIDRYDQLEREMLGSAS